MIKYFRGDTQQEAQDIIDTIVGCKGSKIQTIPYITIFLRDNSVYGFCVVVLEHERECLTQTQLDNLVFIPDGTYGEYV